MAKILIIRHGAFGDSLIITPVLRRLAGEGNELYVLTQERGEKMLRGNPYIKHLEVVPEMQRSDEELHKLWDDTAKKFNVDKTINFTESIEVSLALHPRSPRYLYPKEERRTFANRNYYEFTMEWAGLEWKPEELYGELFYTHEEEEKAKSYIKPDKFNVLFCLSGSGTNKAWPYYSFIWGELLNRYKDDVHIITVGDLKCKLLEMQHPQITCLSGEIDIRQSMALTKYVDLVVSPDTGLLHASGQWDTPKIGLLGHSTIENITKHMRGDFSIQADETRSECAPCFRLIYNLALQCPRDPATGAAYCMSHGLEPKRVMDQIEKVYATRAITV